MSEVSLVNGHIDDIERCVCCGEVIPEGRQYCFNCGNEANKFKPKKQTNYDRIRNMSAAEMAEFVSQIDDNGCDFCKGNCAEMSCKDGFLNWLESEVQGE